MTRADDLVAAWRFYRLLRAWRDESLAGHVWLRVDLHPGHAPTVRPRRYVAARSPRRDCRHGIDMARACDACQDHGGSIALEPPPSAETIASVMAIVDAPYRPGPDVRLEGDDL